jgi:hypothetical protein
MPVSNVKSEGGVLLKRRAISEIADVQNSFTGGVSEYCGRLGMELCMGNDFVCLFFGLQVYNIKDCLVVFDVP